MALALYDFLPSGFVKDLQLRTISLVSELSYGASDAASR